MADIPRVLVLCAPVMRRILFRKLCALSELVESFCDTCWNQISARNRKPNEMLHFVFETLQRAFGFVGCEFISLAFLIPSRNLIPTRRFFFHVLLAKSHLFSPKSHRLNFRIELVEFYRHCLHIK
jgi:hypothetical protein